MAQRLVVFVLVMSGLSAAQGGHNKDWTFAVSGDSRNCGDVVMPSIAAGARAEKAQFYWHLGDFRAQYDFDQDMLVDANGAPRKLTITNYLDTAWPDFIANQVRPFGETPVFLAPGNHEFYSGKTRADYIAQFADWINSPVIQQQRLKDNAADHQVQTYYHWIEGGVDFITLDNATTDQLSPRQVVWFEGVLKRAESDKSVRAVVVGMHAALPDSLACGHSMNDWPQGLDTGHKVYVDLLQFRRSTGKNVYLLASHSHFLVENVFNSKYWNDNGGVLPGWIVGTAGAVRYRLPPSVANAKAAKTDVYGFLLGTVHADGKIDFESKQIDEKEATPDVLKHFGTSVVHACFAENKSLLPAPPPMCY
jgi:hypothetical protein